MLVVVGLVVAFAVVAFYARQNRLTRDCRWRADRSGNDANGHKYRCAACGAVAFSKDDTPPSTCMSRLDVV